MNILTLIKNRIQKTAFLLRKTKYGLRFPLFCKIHGVKSTERQGALRQSKRGDALQIVHTPLNDYPHNVYVYSIPLNRVLGYLDKELSEKLVGVFGENFCRDGEIESMLGGGELKYVGCRISVFESAIAMQDVEDFSHLYGE